MNIDERYRAAEDEVQLEYIKQWRERKRKKKDRRKDYWDGNRLAFTDVL